MLENIIIFGKIKKKYSIYCQNNTLYNKNKGTLTERIIYVQNNVR